MSQARFRLLLLAAALSATAPAAARADRILIQLPSMPAPAVYADGRRAETAVTVFVRTNTVDDGSSVCRNMPLIRDALVVEFSRQAIPVLGPKKLDVAATAPRLIEAINRGLRQPLVKALTFMPGIPTPPLTPAELLDGKREPSRRANDPNVCHRVVEIRDEIAPFVYAPDAPTVTQERAAAQVEPFETHPQMRQEAEVRPIVRAGPVVAKEAPPKGAECDRNVAEYWKPGVYDIGGTRRALLRVFTVDRDGDGRTENVGFLFRAPGVPDVLMHYFDFPDRPSVKAIPALRLADERTIGRLCFGQASFEAMADTPIPAAPPPEPPDAGKEFGATGVWVAIGLAALILILAGALIGFILARKRKAERRRRLERRMAGGEERRKGGSSGYTGPERRAVSRRAETERREGKDRRA